MLQKLTQPWRKQARHAPQWTEVRAGPLSGLQFCLPKSGSGWSGAIARGEYERPLLAQIEALARSGEGGRVLYDLGAHIGLFTSAWIKLGGARVEAFEPVLSNARLVAETAARNKLGGIRVHPVALGHFNGPGTLRSNTENLGKASMAYVQDVGGVESQREGRVYRDSQASAVAVRRLEDYVREHALPPPHALKLDVEGAEARVLQGAGELLARCRPVLLIEIHNIGAGLELAERLSALGYARALVDENGGLPICRWNPA